MKKFILPICAFALSVGFFSCDDDDEESISFGGKHLTKFSYYDYHSYPEVVDKELAQQHPYEYDSLGNPMGWTTIIDSTLQEVEFRYDSKGRLIQFGSYTNYVYKGSTLTAQFSDDEILTENYNSSGYITSYKLTSDYELNATILYDDSWHILSEESNLSTKVTNENNETIVQTKSSKTEYVWEDGNIIKIYDDLESSSELGKYPYTFKYTDEDVTVPIENKANIQFIRTTALSLGMSMAAGYRYGAKSKNLPVSMISNDGVEIKLVWTLDNDGYPSGLIFGDVTCKFAWE